MKTLESNTSETAQHYIEKMNEFRPRKVNEIHFVEKDGKYLSLSPSFQDEPAEIQWVNLDVATILNHGCAHTLAYLLGGTILRHEEAFK